MAAPTTPSRETLIRLRFEEGMSREKMAEHFDVSIATIRRWIKEQNIPRPSFPKTTKKAKLATDTDIKARLGDGYTQMERATYALGGRLVEVKGKGYYLDGKPTRLDAIYAAAGV